MYSHIQKRAEGNPPCIHYLMNGSSSSASILHLKRIQIFQHVFALSLRHGFVQRPTSSFLSTRQKLAHVSTTSFSARGQRGRYIFGLFHSSLRGAGHCQGKKERKKKNSKKERKGIQRRKEKEYNIKKKKEFKEKEKERIQRKKEIE